VQVFLFRWAESDLYAVTAEQTGRNLPAGPDNKSWSAAGSFDLDGQLPKYVAPHAEEARRGLATQGFYSWHAVGHLEEPITPDESF
jgi:hypothetical protein